MQNTLWVIAGVAGAAVVALIVVEVIHRIVRRLGRHSALLSDLARQAHRPFQILAALFAAQFALRILAPSFSGRDEVLHMVLLVMIGVGAWLVAALLLVFEDVALATFRTDVADNLRARRLHTQVVMLRRLTVAVIVIIAIGAGLMTFPAVRAVGATVLASAGLAGVVAALAAQSLLSNVFAGLQLAFSDAVRLEDVVVVEGEWGRVEEMTLSNVVVHIWDDRRLILPSSYFTTKPFENWTRSAAAVLGTVEIDMDWSVPVPELREELRAMVEGNELWDGRQCVLQVTEATGGYVRVRALVSAADAPSLWDLRCLVREHLVAWVRDQRPTALPRLRTEVAGAEHPGWEWTPDRAGREAGDGAGEDARVFSGSDDGDARGHVFVGPEEKPPATN
ncbi:MAG TPA: mechanosensitive ion channel domain-containing protein [Pilimelia sp.]|nr:mechanosensitive ion channel domain-containing protein [Pilimelia sp.]